MNFIDLLLLAPLIYGGYKGFKHGLIIEIFTLLAFVVGIYAGNHLSEKMAEFLTTTFDLTSEYLPLIAFTIVFLLVGAGVYFAGKTLEKAIKMVALSPLNKFLGLFFGLIKTLYILSVILIMFDGYDRKNKLFKKETKDTALLYHPIIQFSKSTIPGLANSSIFVENFFQEDSDSTGLTIDEVLRAKEVADSLGIDAQDAAQILEIHQKYGKSE